jgi:para-aminobenzoate synthetase
MKPAPILCVDAHDSFSENIVALLREELNTVVTTIKIDTCLEDPASFFRNFRAIVLGPGPGRPDNATDTGLFNLVWKYATESHIPVLGICLGFQNLCVNLGLSVTRLDLPCHGHSKRIRHEDADIFEGAGEVYATCYNSLGVRLDDLDVTPEISRPPSSASSESGQSSSSVAGCHTAEHAPFTILACDDEGYIMAVRHVFLPFWGVQFHPESCKSSDSCKRIMRNWWAQVDDNGHCKPATTPHCPTGENEAPALTPGRLCRQSPVFNYMESRLGGLHTGVCYQRLPFKCDQQQITDLCHSMSKPGSTAMLESTKRGRFSIYAFPDETSWSIEYNHSEFSLSTAGREIARESVPIERTMETIQELLSQHLVLDGDPNLPFWGGLIGYFSYEAGLDLLKVSTSDQNASRCVPDLSLMFVERSIVIDHEDKTLIIQTIRRSDDDWLAEMISEVSALTTRSTPATACIPPVKMINAPSHSEYISRIRSCQSSLHAGDSYELCLTTSSTLATPTPSYDLYTSLQSRNPAPYASYLDFPSTTLISSSPEQFLSWSRSAPHLNMMPMKGTLPKSSTINTIAAAREQLLTPKEEAENLMIVDLIRHDLHRSLGPQGKVSVEKLFEVVETETLYQLISHIRGHIPLPPEAEERVRRETIMRAGHKALRHSLPPGSMTGAPKKRSCEILRRLEGRNRGVYSGVVGYFDIGGGGGWSVAIRCAYSANDRDGRRGDDVGRGRGEREWHVGAGGAITVLSEQESEWEEMRAKMGSVLKGLCVEQ